MAEAPDDQSKSETTARYLRMSIRAALREHFKKYADVKEF